MMELFVVRHAIAVPAGEGLTDDARPLSEDGRARFVRCVRGMRRLGFRFDRLVHSPLLRAVQTAEELTPLLTGESMVHAGLAGPPTPELVAELRGAGERLALVGHEPWLGELASFLMGGRTPCLELKKGAVAHLRGELVEGGMDLVALLPPRVLVRVGP